MEGPNILAPTLKERQRYIAYHVISQKPIEFSGLVNAIWYSLLTTLGELGTAQAYVWIIRNAYDEKKQIGLIRCSHVAVEHVRAALALVQRIEDVQIIIRVLGISGTIKGARKKFFGEVDLLSFVK